MIEVQTEILKETTCKTAPVVPIMICPILSYRRVVGIAKDNFVFKKLLIVPKFLFNRFLLRIKFVLSATTRHLQVAVGCHRISSDIYNKVILAQNYKFFKHTIIKKSV